MARSIKKHFFFALHQSHLQLTTTTFHLHFSLTQNHLLVNMYALTIIVAALSLATASPASDFASRQVAAVASVDRFTGPGCTETICNIAGSGDLRAGCNAITDSCQGSLKLNYANVGCKGKCLSDEKRRLPGYSS
jgi:hypothetical protein